MRNLGREVTDENTVKNEEFGRRSERRKLYRDGTGRHIHGKGSQRFGGNRSNHGEDRGNGKHINNGRRDGVGPHHEEGCNVNPTRETKPEDRRYKGNRQSSHRGSYRHHIIETKLFTSKEELVEYVNSRTDQSNKVDIFKIEDGLYKVEIK